MNQSVAQTSDQEDDWAIERACLKYFIVKLEGKNSLSFANCFNGDLAHRKHQNEEQW